MFIAVEFEIYSRLLYGQFTGTGKKNVLHLIKDAVKWICFHKVKTLYM